MYTRPKIYKAYSIIIALAGIISFINSIIVASQTSMGIFEQNDFVKNMVIVIKIVIVVTALISLFFVYMDFSSMFTFAEMIEYEQREDKTPFFRKRFVLPAKAYRTFGSVIFSINLIVYSISAIVLTIVYSVNKGAFIALPVLPILLFVIILALNYITYYCRYKGFADVLELVSSKEAKQTTLESLKENKTGILRTYCNILYILSIILVIGIIALLVFINGALFRSLGGFAWFAICMIVALGVIEVLCLAVTGCFFDNLAKMIEHYQIKYNLLEYKK